MTFLILAGVTVLLCVAVAAIPAPLGCLIAAICRKIKP